MLLGEDAVGLLLTAGSDEGVDLLDLDVVELLDRFLDEGLAGLAVNDEDEGVVVLNGLDGGLSSTGVLHDSILVPSVLLDSGLSLNLGSALLVEGLGQAEGGLEPHLVLLDLVGTLLDCFLDSCGLNINGHARAHTVLDKLCSARSP